MDGTARRGTAPAGGGVGRTGLALAAAVRPAYLVFGTFLGGTVLGERHPEPRLAGVLLLGLAGA